MTATGIPGAGPGGVLRMTWVQDRPARVLEHSDTDEPSGSWTGLACSDDGLTAGADVNTTTPASAAGLRPARRPGLGSPGGLAARHAQLFQATLRALLTAAALRPPNGFRSRPAPYGPRRGRPAARRSQISSTRA